MPTLFERIDVGLAGNDLSLRVSAQAGNLNAVANTVAGLISSPPQGISDLQRALRELPLPNLTGAGDLVTTINSLKAVLPTDLSSVTGTLTSGFQQLGAGLGNDLAGVLEETLQALSALERLTKIDLSCAGTAAGGASGATPTVSTPAPPASGGATTGSTAPSGGAAPAGGTTPAATSPNIATLDQFSAVFDGLPSPLTVENVLAWLREVTNFPRRNRLLPFPLPLLDDLLDPLETLSLWRAMQPVDVRTHIAATLTSLDAFITSSVEALLNAVAADVADIAGRLRTDALTQIADGLTARLVELRVAVNAGNLSGAGAGVAAVNSLLDQYDAIRPGLQTGVLVRLPALTERLGSLPDDLEGRISHLISVLRPSNTSRQLESLALPAVESGTEGLTELVEWVKTLVNWVQDLVNKIDLAALQTPIREVAEKARAAVEGLDEGMVKVTLETQKLFGEVESVLSRVDTEALAAQIDAAIQKFKTELTQNLAALFAPVREIVGQVTASISAGLDTFNPEEIIDSLRQVIQSLVGVLQDPAVVAALDNIRNAVDAAAQQLESLSFAPLTDEVIAGIEEIGDLLQSIDTSQLNGALQAALQAALSVLPDDLTPVTDPLLNELGGLVETGPVTLIATVQAQPQQLLDKVRQFEPAALVGDALSKPFQDLLKQMDAFKPSMLLKPVQAELDKLKDRLRKSANPGRAIQPLEQPFTELMQGFDRLRPDALVKPLEEQLTHMIDAVLKALPVEELSRQAGAVLKKAEDVVNVVTRVSAFIQRLQDVLAGLANAETQIETWVNAVLDKIDAMPDPGRLQPLFTRLTESLDRMRAAALSARISGAFDPLLATLNTFDGQNRLTALIQAYRGISRPALAALPDSPEKTALGAALDRFNPLQPAFGVPYQRLAEWRQNLSATKSGLQAALADWDARYHDAGGTLDCLRMPAATPAQLRAWIRAALESQFIVPLKALFGFLEPFARVLGTLLAPVRSLIADLETKLSSLLRGPDSLGGINDALQQLVARLRAFDLGFLRESLADVHAQVRGKLDAVSPAHFRQVVEQSFDEMLQTLDLGQVVSPADLAALDADFAGVIAKLKTLDPGQLVVKLVQPEFEQKVVPLLASFDLTKLLEVLVKRLRGLEDELKQELGRVNEAYRALRRSLPSLSGSIDVGISF